MTLGSGGYNYWYSNGTFRVGGPSSYAIWNGSSFVVKGNITADSGTFNGTVNAGAGTFSGNITLSGRLQASTVAVGNMNHINGYYNGIDLSGGFINCFIRGNGGEVFFRVDNGSQWIKYENGSVSISAAGFSIIGGNATFSGNLSGAGGSLTSGMSIGGSLVIGDNVRINNATGDGGITTFKARGNGNTSGTYAARFQRLNANYIMEVRNDLRVGLANSTYTISDQRAKTNIQDSDLGLNFINRIKPRSYNKIDNYTEILEDKSNDIQPLVLPKKMYGFIAQEIKEVIDFMCPEYDGWEENEETGIQAISYEELISPIVKAIQELSKKIDDIEMRMI